MQTTRRLPDMFRLQPTEQYKFAIIAFGMACLLFALVTIPTESLTPGLVGVMLFSIYVAPRMTLTLPRSELYVSFSDSVVFFTFLLYGGEIAIIVAFVETLANCIYLKRTSNLNGRWVVLFNASIGSLVTAFAFAVYAFVSWGFGGQAVLTDTRNLIIALGILSIGHFLASSLVVSVYRRIKSDEDSLWQIWKKECLSTSMAQLTGAGIAGVIYKLINYADPVVILVAAASLLILYLSYRQSIGDISSAFDQVEEAERQKAETERTRRVEVEEFAGQLSIALSKEEQANKALRKSERDFAHAAMHDSLTGLANRKNFGDVLRRLIADYKVDPSKEFQVLFLDIRSFKNINDTLGHTIGDKVLTIAAKRFVRMLDVKDTVARIGGDEFAIILRGLGSTAKAEKVARRIYQNITQPFSLSGNSITVDINIGIAACDVEYDTPEEILRDADIAMHYAKEKGNGLAVFTKALRERFLERIRLEMDLRYAVDRNELALHYQPIISLSDGRLVGFEALVRWYHTELGMIPPVKFIPIAEDSGLIKPITVWILEEACRQLSKWQSLAGDYRSLMVSVNISGKHLGNNDLIHDVERALDLTHIHPSSLKLEITESAAMENPDHTVNMLTSLKDLGVQLSIDDFGTGYSSLSHLHKLPFDTLKIDRSFVSGVGANGEGSEILQTIISLAKNLRMRVVAEGIETEAQLRVLQNLGCDLGQGYLMAKPKGRDETEKLLYQRPSWLPEVPLAEYDDHQISGTIDAHLPVF
ncbi:MAG TPA: EAL domain-containing protein [Pyrinomonadaceae bacterium]|nr:EAL domain-containing protein [Pyrinomonadaceae bacterium]